jgi:class 3 adenylate cyclase
MNFTELLEQARELLRSKGRVSYRALKLQFSLDDDHLEGLKDELIEAERVADDENGKVLVWVGEEQRAGSEVQGAKSEDSPKLEKVQSPKSKVQSQETRPLTSSTQHLSGERRQLTVVFCDLVGSTALSAQLDPEDYRAVVQQYQQTSATVCAQYDGHIAQHLGVGL